MRFIGRRYWCRTRDSVLFLGCPIDLELVDESRLKNHPSSSEELALPSDTNNGESEDDNYLDEDEDEEQRKFNFVDKYIKKNYGSLFYLGQAVVGPNLTEWSERNEVYLAIHLPENCNIPNLTRFFANFDQSVLDKFRTLMNLLGQLEKESEPELCSCQDNIG
jgi:hypothetical protein